MYYKMYHDSFYIHIETSRYLQFQKIFYIRKHNFMEINTISNFLFAIIYYMYKRYFHIATTYNVSIIKKLSEFKKFVHTTHAYRRKDILPSDAVRKIRMFDLDASERDSLSNVSTGFTGFQRVFASCKRF